jgi:hypothetical protein
VPMAQSWQHRSVLAQVEIGPVRSALGAGLNRS